MQSNRSSANSAQPKLRVAINGFGRVGRNVFRALYQHPAIELVAVADAAQAEPLAYLLRFDTLLGRFPDELGVVDDTLIVGGQRIAFLTGVEAGVDLQQYEVDVLIEARSRAKHTRLSLEQQLSQGVERVVLCVRPEEAPDATIVMGINDQELTAAHRIISNGSGTAHCVAPILRILERAFGIERAFLSTVHAYTDQQRLADVPAEHPRSGRAAAENIIPSVTNAARVLDEILPECRGKISAQALNVPVHNGSLVDLVCWHQESVTEASLNEVVRTAASTEEFRRTLYYEDDPIVSTDIVGTKYSSIFDSDATMVLGGDSPGQSVSKTIAWFDNGWAYALRLVDLLERIRDLKLGQPSKGDDR